MHAGLFRSGAAAVGLYGNLGFMLSVVLACLFMSDQATVEGRLLRFPDIHDGKIVFTYAGDIWTVSEGGGIARKLTNHPGVESHGRFSPDGKLVAFTATYDGNVDVYVMPSDGGEPRRLTFSPYSETVLDWTPDGKSIIFRSAKQSVNGRYPRMFTVPVAGGLSSVLPMDEAALGSPSPDGNVYAYNRVTTENAAWKRYRGGLQSYISFYDIKANRYWEMDHDDSSYLWPNWVGDKIYYANDSNGTYNLFSYDIKTKKVTRLTNYTDYDVRWPSSGGDKLVFERDLRLWVFDIKTSKVSAVPIRILTDDMATRPYRMELGGMVSDVTISPSGARVGLAARGELFSVPVKEGLTYNLSKSPGVREIMPRWSPDGKWILFGSDKTGEFEFYIQKSDLSEDAVQVTFGSSVYRNEPVWAPDGKKFCFTDVANRLWVTDIETKATTFITEAQYGGLRTATWSPDSKWLAFTKFEKTGFSQIYVYSLESKTEHKLSDGMFDDASPVFDAESKYLFFVSARDFNPQIGVFELTFTMQNPQRIYGWTLRKDYQSPFAPKNEVERIAEPKKEEGEKKPVDKPQEQPVEKPSWDLEGIGGRMFSLPLPPGMYALVASVSGRLFYVSGGNLFAFDFGSKQSQTIFEGLQAFGLTPKGDKMVYLAQGMVGVVPTQPGQKPGSGRVSTLDVEAVVDPRAEWTQSYWDAWRYERDHFWSPTINGIKWKEMGDKYAKWLPYLGHRSDLDYLLRELLGELGTGHAYVLPGPMPGVTQVQIGQLGADYETTPQGVRFKKIYRGHSWVSSRRAPLNEPGMNINEGDYLLAIDGDRVGPNTNVDELLVGKADKLVEIAVNSSPTLEGARKILVQPVSNDSDLRYADWIDSRLEYVTKKSNGRIGYVYVPDTSIEGIIEFYRMFYPQVEKDALIIDERYNGGGFIPTFFIETLARKTLAYWKPRHGDSFRTPEAAVIGPKAMLINHYAGSGGDAFPYFFRKMGFGPLIGKRTWGGLVGIFGSYSLMAGGAVTAPQFAVWDVGKDGKPEWIVENIGVYPDIEVDNRPDLVYLGEDPQLDRAIEYLMRELEKHPPKRPTHPSYRGG